MDTFQFWLTPYWALAMSDLVNAVNMIDGINGLAGDIVVAMLSWLAFVAGSAA